MARCFVPAVQRRHLIWRAQHRVSGLKRRQNVAGTAEENFFWGGGGGGELAWVWGGRRAVAQHHISSIFFCGCCCFLFLIWLLFPLVSTSGVLCCCLLLFLLPSVSCCCCFCCCCCCCCCFLFLVSSWSGSGSWFYLVTLLYFGGFVLGRVLLYENLFLAILEVLCLFVVGVLVWFSFQTQDTYCNFLCVWFMFFFLKLFSLKNHPSKSLSI